MSAGRVFHTLLADGASERLAEARGEARFESAVMDARRAFDDEILVARRHFGGYTSAWAADAADRATKSFGIAGLFGVSVGLESTAHRACGGRVNDVRPMFGLRDGRDEWLRSAISAEHYLGDYQRGARAVGNAIEESRFDPAGWLFTVLSSIYQESGTAGVEGAFSVLQEPLAPEGERVITRPFNGAMQRGNRDVNGPIF